MVRVTQIYSFDGPPPALIPPTTQLSTSIFRFENDTPVICIRNVNEGLANALRGFGCLYEAVMAFSLEPCCQVYSLQTSIKTDEIDDSMRDVLRCSFQKASQIIEKEHGASHEECCDVDTNSGYRNRQHTRGTKDRSRLVQSYTSQKVSYQAEKYSTSSKNSRCCGSETRPSASQNSCGDQNLGSCLSELGKIIQIPQDSSCLISSQSCVSSCSRKESSSLLKSKLPKGIDLEASDFVEHVVLNVQGLTCTGCEGKLFKALQNIPGVCNLRTSLVLSQAEFDLDERAGPLGQLVKAVEKSTGFVCQQLNNEGQEIDVEVDDAEAFAECKYPGGVIEICAISKHTARIKFETIGVRTLVEESFTKPLTLANPRTPELDGGKTHVRNSSWITLLSMILTIPVLILGWAPIPPLPIIYGSISLVLATAVQVVIVGPFYPRALKVLYFAHLLDTDLLVILSTSTAYIFSVISFACQVAGRPLPIGEFFETSTLLVTLIMLGRYLSIFARYRALKSASIRSLQARKAILCDEDGSHERTIDARLLQHGDLFKSVPDSLIATDGVVVFGSTEIDESMITGEALPVEKFPGSTVIAGSHNSSGVIVIRLTHLPAANTINAIASMVDEAKFSKPKAQELVDVISGYFVPVILALTVITFVIWIAVGICIRRQNSGHAIVNAITYSISVLIVSCPCAIGLAIPMVTVIAGSIAAGHGVVIKSASVIDTACNITNVVFDKTGTLTRGHLIVTETKYLSDDESTDSIVLGLTSNSKHPVSVAISRYLEDKGVKSVKAQNLTTVIGKGVEGIVHGSNARCGNVRWLSAEALPEVQDLLTKELTVFGVERENEIIAVFGLSDELRPESQSVVSELRRRNIAVSILSGDDYAPVKAVAARLGIPADCVKARCTPSDKQLYLKNLLNDEKIVIFCGDGANDAVALAQASIGIHIKAGSDTAQSAADVVLLYPNLKGILLLLDLSKAASRRIFLNLFWSFLYNLFAILLAAGAFVDARILPQYAGLGEFVSVLPVILISLNLRGFKHRDRGMDMY